MENCRQGWGLGKETGEDTTVTREVNACLWLVTVSEHVNLESLPMIFTTGLVPIFKELGRPPGLMEQMATKMHDSNILCSEKSPSPGPQCPKSPI